MNDDDARLIRSSSLMGLGTIISRVTGLARNLLLVAVLGTGILGDAYNVANTTPNILYNLLIGGALSAVFVPQIVKSFRDNDGGAIVGQSAATHQRLGITQTQLCASLLFGDKKL